MAARRTPRINDISTDRDHPPEFLISPPKRPGYNAGRLRGPTECAYPDVNNLVLSQPPQAVYRRVLDLIRVRGWRLAAQEDAARRVQAVAISRWLRFRDDVVVEVRPQAGGPGSVVAMRSKSRLGRGDLGANARRIRAFCHDLQSAP